MFLDISGFTALCEKYTMTAKTGTEQLTKTLNDYMSRLVSEMLSYDGDILKFAGDAILTMWKVESTETTTNAERIYAMRATVHHVIRCALDIQKKYGAYQTSAGVILKV